MRDRPALVVLLVGTISALLAAPAVAAQQPVSYFAPGSMVPGRGALPNPDNALVLADRYLADATRHADQADTRILRQVQAAFRRIEENPDSVAAAISGLVTQLTLSLAGGQSLAGVTMLSAFLVKLDPHNPRVTNLFGAVLHAGGRLRDASDLLELSVRQSAGQPNGGVLARLNLANVYIDRNLDAKAKALLDSMVRHDPANKRAWRVMALYWYKRGNFDAQRAALLKGANPGIGLVKRKVAPVDAVVTKHEVAPGDAVPAMEQKLAELSKVRPLTSADLIEDIDPQLAQAIRKEAHAQLMDQLWKLPRFPEVNTQDNKGYAAGMPIIEDFIRWFATQYGDHKTSELLGATGITLPTGEGPISARDSAQLDAQGRAYAAKEMTRALQQAQDAMKFLKGSTLPGVSQAQVDEAMRQVSGTAASQKVKLKNTPVDTATPPGFDHGGPFARANYRNYLVTTRSYERYFRAYYRKFDDEEKDYIRVYSEKAALEMAEHERNTADIDKRFNGMTFAGPGALELKKEELRYKRAMNLIGDTYFKKWANLYVPEYTQRMKPMLEAYWATAVVYLRNMVDPAVAAREYFRVYGLYAETALKAGTYAGDGAAFVYIAATEDELAALEAEIRDATAEVPAKHIRFMRDSVPRARGQMPRYKEASDLRKDNPDWYDFLNGQGEVDLKGQFLNLKLSRQKCEFRAWAFGPMAGVNFDFAKSQVQTYYGLSARFEMGLKVGNVGVAAKASLDYIAQVNTIDMVAGTLSEAYPDEFVLSVSAKGTLARSDVPVFEASADLKYNATAGWSSTFNGKAGTVSMAGTATAGGTAGNTATLSAKDGFGPFTASAEIAYSSKGGLSGKTGLSAGVGPFSSSAQATASSQTGVQVVANAGGTAGPVSVGKTVTYNQSGAATATNVTLALSARTKDDQPQIDSELRSKFAQEFDVLAVGQRAIKDLSLPRP